LDSKIKATKQQIYLYKIQPYAQTDFAWWTTEADSKCTEHWIGLQECLLELKTYVWLKNQPEVLIIIMIIIIMMGIRELNFFVETVHYS
jgi:hypothetical protein